MASLIQAILARTPQRVVETAVVTAVVAANLITINASGSDEQAWCPLHLTPAAGDTVAIVRAPRGTLVVAHLTSGIGATPPEAPDTAEESGVSLFPALYTWTWELTADSRTQYAVARFPYWSNLYQGTAWPGDLPYRHGYWYWNRAVPSALRGVTVDSARIRVTRAPGGPASGDVQLIFMDTNTIWPPGTDPVTTEYSPTPIEPWLQTDSPVVTVTRSMTPGETAWIDLAPGLTYLQAMVDNGDEPPLIGINGTDDLGVAGLDRDPESGLLEITWHRE